MVRLLCWALPVLALLGQSASEVVQDCDLADEGCDHLVLLQTVTRTARKSTAPQQNYWGHARGSVGSLTQTKYSVPASSLSNLSASLAWKWVHPQNLSAFVWGTLIDHDRNIIIAAMQGIFKYSPDNQLIWKREDIRMTQMPVLMGNALYGMMMGTANVYALDLQTGNSLWSHKVALTTGQEGDMVEGHNGVLVVAVDMGALPSPVGTPAKRAIGVNASTGRVLWSYTPDCGIWNIMALFPDDYSTVFMDDCGGLYRVNLRDGSEIWRHIGSHGSMTDGGNVLGPDGSVYTCSNGPDTQTTMNAKGSKAGRLRKYNVQDGSMLWEAVLPNACMNFPSVSPDGQTVVLADGANVLDPPMKWVHGKSQEMIEREWALQQSLLRNKTQLQHYGFDTLDASLSGFDAHTGALKWKHDVEPWYGMSFALDEERAYLWDKGMHPFGHCGPPHWGGPTIDQEGKVYVARSDGELYIYDPASDSETKFHTGDGALMAGVAFAPGLMVVPTCSWVYVFKF